MKFNNNNQAVIKKITKRSLKRNKIRNIFAIAAIILTTFMISTVFGIGISFIKNYKIMNNRLTGTMANTELASPTKSQVSKLTKSKYFNSIGYEIKAGKVYFNNEDSSNTSIAMRYLSSDDYEKQIKPCISNIKGKYPKKQNEIMISEIGLKFLNKKNVKIGDTINLKYVVNDKEYTSDFVISGTFKTFGVVQETGYIYVSKEYVNKEKLTLENNGELLMNIKSKYKNNAKDTLKHEVSLKDKQKFNFSFNEDQDSKDSVVVSLALASIISLFVILSGYLLIYNILYIAVVKDTNFYGLLKTIGTSPSQIKKIVKGQSLRLSLIGIPIGLILSILVSFVVVPVAIKGLAGGSYYGSAMPSEISFNPLIFMIAALFSLFTVAISCRKPAKLASKISPVEALKYTGVKKSKKKYRKSTNGGKLHKMAWYNVFRDKKRAVIVFLSLFMGIITFLGVNTFFNALDVKNYINKYLKYDYEIQNVNTDNRILTNKVVNKIKDLEGVKSINSSRVLGVHLNFDDKLIKDTTKISFKYQGYNSKDYDELYNNIKESDGKYGVDILGVDDETIKQYNKDAKDTEKININDFKSGKIALAIPDLFRCDNPKEYKYLNNEKFTITNMDGSVSKTFQAKMVLTNSDIIPSGYAMMVGTPTIVVSNDVLDEIDKDSIINYLLQINVESKYNQKLNNDLKDLSSKNGLYIESKIDRVNDFKTTTRIMTIIGNGISLVLVLIGILNFINVMITGVYSRLKELAVLESIGMTKKQIKKMLTFEGLYYALITTLSVLTLGTVIIKEIASLTKKIVDYAAFVFPTVPLILVVIEIFIICLVTPSIVFHISSKSSVTERIRETAN